MGILNLVYCYLFLFVSLAVMQAIYIEMVFCKESMSVPLSLESWHLLKVDREQFILIRVFISFVFKSVNLSILQKTINKTSKSPHAFAMCSNRTNLLKQENEKIDSLQIYLDELTIICVMSCTGWDRRQSVNYYICYVLYRLGQKVVS